MIVAMKCPASYQDGNLRSPSESSFNMHSISEEYYKYVQPYEQGVPTITTYIQYTCTCDNQIVLCILYVCVWVLVTSKDTNGVKAVLKSYLNLIIHLNPYSQTTFQFLQPPKSTMKIMDNVGSPKMIMRLQKGLQPVVVLQLGSSSMNALCTNCMMAIVKILI